MAAEDYFPDAGFEPDAEDFAQFQGSDDPPAGLPWRSLATYEGWNAAGFRIKRGERGTRSGGEILFHYGQVEPKVAAPTMDRYWINCSSTHYPEHAHHGMNVIGPRDLSKQPQVVTVYPAEGEFISITVRRLYLSKGWTRTKAAGQAALIEERIHYHFRELDGSFRVPKELPFMKEFLNMTERLCATVRGEPK